MTELGGEVFCVTKGDEQQLTQWLDAKPDRYVVWIGPEKKVDHPRILNAEDDELSLQQIATQLLYLPFVYEEGAHPALQRLARIQTEIHFRATDYLDQGIKLLTNFRSNLQNPTKLATECFGRFEKFPVIVCGAGPSLQEIIPFLKQNNDRFLIVGCGAGMQALLTAGVQPHLAVHVDPDPYHKFPKTSIPLFYQLRTSHEVVSQMKGPHFLMTGSGEFPLEGWIEQKMGLEFPTDGGWTAATRGASLVSALGCRSIYFAGIDFSATSKVYAKGVQPPQEGSLIKITLPDGTTVQTRSDWLLAAEWMNKRAVEHPDIKWGLLSKTNPLMPALEAVELNHCLGVGGVSLFASQVFEACPEKSGKAIWQEMSQSFKTCRTLVDQFLSRFQKIFPGLPSGDEACLSLLKEIDAQEAVHLVIDPVWNHWEIVLKRSPENHPDAMIVHRILLIKTLSDRFYA